jgi:hypothetical protein
VANRSRAIDRRQVSSIPNDEQMDNILFGDADPAPVAGTAAPRKIETDRGNCGRVSVGGCA